MSDKFEVMHHALNLAGTAKDAMVSGSGGEPDETTWQTAQVVLMRAQEMLPQNAIVQSLQLKAKQWSSLRTAMEAVANALSSAATHERNEGLLARNRRVLRNMR